MKLHYYRSVVAALLLCAALARAANDFDYFYHVQQWPGSYCATEDGCCIPGNQKPEAEFGIHGLWPQYAECRTVDDAGRPLNQSKCWPDSCNDADPLDLSLIRNLESDLLRNWGTLSCKAADAAAFWRHEWSKHGTCSGMDQRSYFRAALDFKARFNLTRILLDAGVVPSDERPYCLSSIRDAVAEATGSAPNLECSRNERNETQLYQVYQCVGADGRSPISCPVSMDIGCTDTVKFPVFHAPGYGSTGRQPALRHGQDEL